MTRWLAFTLLVVAAGALALRLPDLDRRPMHNDEAVNALVLQALWERGEYRYNPDEYHGPSLHYASLPFLWLSGAADFDHLSERALRLVTVVAGAALVLLLWPLRDALGGVATTIAAILVAGSPAMVFYSRYFIHEMLLVAFTLLLLAAGWRYWRTRRAGWAALAGIALGLIHATKETFVITLAAMTLAVVFTVAWGRWHDQSRLDWRSALNLRHLALALSLAGLVSLTLFTSFFTHPRGPLDSILTYLPWLHRAGGNSPHLHPWSFYFERLFWFRPARGPLWTEACIGGLALVGLGSALARQRSPTRSTADRSPADASVDFARFVGFFTLACAVAYSLIPYKTPWCLLNFLLPMILLAGHGAAALWNRASRGAVRRGFGVLLAAAFLHLVWQAWRAAFPLASDRANPYVYAQTVPNAVELANRVKAIASVSPDGAQTEVRVIAPESDYWPLPWYLRQLRNVWWLDQLPEGRLAPVMIVAAHLRAGLDETSNRRYLSVGYYELRPRVFFELYVEFELWKRFVETLPRPPDDE